MSSKGSKGVRLLSYRILTGSKQQGFLLGSVVRDWDLLRRQRPVHRRTLWASMHTSALLWSRHGVEVLNTGAGVTLSAPLPCEKQSSRSCLFFTSHLSQTPKCSASFSSCSKLSPRAKGSKKLRIPSQLCSTKEVKQKNNATALVYTSGTSGHFRTAKQRSFRVHSALLLPSYSSNSNERSGGDTE